MKLPSNWNNSTTKAPSIWAKLAKTAVAWTGSSVTRTDAPASQWQAANPKTPNAWKAGEYAYDSFLPYDTVISYDGTPDPYNTKVPTTWSNA